MTIICKCAIQSVSVGKSVSLGNGFRKITESVRLFIDSRYFVIPAGFEWDGASIPRIAWAIYGHPFDAIHELAGLVHDAIYSGVIKGYTRKEADEIYYALIRANGQTWWRAQKEYYAIRLFGASHWRVPCDAARGIV